MTSIQILAVYCLIFTTNVYFNTMKSNSRNLMHPVITNLWVSIVFFLPMFTLILYCLKI